MPSGVPTPPHIEEQIRRLRRAGNSYEDIARFVGVNKGTVVRVCKVYPPIAAKPQHLDVQTVEDEAESKVTVDDSEPVEGPSLSDALDLGPPGDGSESDDDPDPILGLPDPPES